MVVAALPLLGLLLSAPAVLASYAKNLNYHSPSLNHPELGLAVRKIYARSSPPDLVNAFPADKLSFTHGVASGDPTASAVILWTRLSPEINNSDSNVTVSGTAPMYDRENERYVAVSKAPVCVEYRVSEQKDMKRSVDKGEVWTSSDVDWTVKVDATGLKPFRYYYYQFATCGGAKKSKIGRTKTLPRANDKKVSEIKLAVFSCANYPFGFFNAYGTSAEKDNVDYVVHLGDLIYEYPEGGYGWGYSIDRVHSPNKSLASLYDYRTRHAQYRADPDQALSMATYPYIATWDDHEVGDNTYRGGMAYMNNTEDSFLANGGISVDQVKMNAVRAYFEWMPMRQVEMDDNLRIWRKFQIGGLIDLIMLDTRNYDRSITDLYWNTDYIEDIKNEGSRTVLGHRQESWFHRQLTSSKATWRILGQQLLFASLNTPLGYNLDTWAGGYIAARNRTLKVLADNKIDNTIILAGDSHANWVSEIYYQSATNPLAVEFGGSAVTSPSPAGENVTQAFGDFASEWIVTQNKESRWQEMVERGYYEVSVSKEKVESVFWGVGLKKGDRKERELARFQVTSGSSKLKGTWKKGFSDLKK